LAGAGFLREAPVKADGLCVKRCTWGPAGFALCANGTKFAACWNTPIPGVCKVKYCTGFDDEEYDVEPEEGGEGDIE
jgi:hypothetical protein